MGICHKSGSDYGERLYRYSIENYTNHMLLVFPSYENNPIIYGEDELDQKYCKYSPNTHTKTCTVCLDREYPDPKCKNHIAELKFESYWNSQRKQIIQIKPHEKKTVVIYHTFLNIFIENPAYYNRWIFMTCAVVGVTDECICPAYKFKLERMY